jgi:hypothetical protein
MECVHCFRAEGGGGVRDQGDVVPEFHAEATGRLEAREVLTTARTGVGLSKGQTLLGRSRQLKSVPMT